MIIFCPKCGQKCEIEDQYAGAAVACPTCNEEFLAEPPRIVAKAVPVDAVNGKKINRVVYIILAIFLGSIGIHNFYAKQIKLGIFKIITWVLFWVLFVGFFEPNMMQNEYTFLRVIGVELMFFNGASVVFDMFVDPSSKNAERRCFLRVGILIAIVLSIQIIGVSLTKLGVIE